MEHSIPRASSSISSESPSQPGTPVLEPSVAVDTVGPVRYGAGDVLVLCSDGLTKVVTPPEILKQATLFAPGEACRALVILARERGGPDNISLQVLRAREGKAL